MKRNRFLSFFLAGLMLFSFLSVFPNDSLSPLTMMEANAAEGRLYNQNDSYWKAVTFTKYASSRNSMYTSGCGIFSFCNAIYALNGSKIRAEELATWAVNNGSYQPGNGGLYRQAFYNRVQSGYGSSYGFKIDGQYYGTISDTRLINHLKNGGVAAIHVSNHFMAVTGYNVSNGTYHVIESAVYSGRGLQADSWVSASKLSSGATDVDWYALISNTLVSDLDRENFSIYTDKTSYSVGETVTFNFTSKGETELYIPLDYNGVRSDFIDVTGKTSYSCSFDKAGTYGFFLYGRNSLGETSTVDDYQEIIIYDDTPSGLSITNDKSEYALGETVTFEFESVNAAELYIPLDYNGVRSDFIDVTGKTSYSCSFDKAGTYGYFLYARNKYGENSTVVEYKEFKVYDSAPQELIINNNKKAYRTGEQVEFSFSAAYSTELYIPLDYNGKRIDFIDVTDKNSYICTLEEPGTYGYFLVGRNQYGESTTVDNYQEFIVYTDRILTFDANGGTTPTATKSILYNTAYGSLPKPTRTGYTFAGWYTAKEGGTQITEDSIVSVTTDQTLYAHWTANKYTITFNTNGGSCDTTSKSVTYNSTYGDLPTPTRTGHVFKGWFTAESGGTQITKDSKVTITANQTLYAQWKLNSYTVTLDANGGTVSDDSVTVTYSKGYGTLPKPTRDGYTFLGWFTAADGGTEVTASTTVTTNKNHTLYAHWEKNKVVGDVNADGTFNVADVVMLQKWLICIPNATLTDWQAADMCDDDIINVLDMCLMKRELISKS
ncbi:MAG: InlB B-repeat-containing protein [Oscillospiraceae bacterium]|nr:InlB B-repeat-containing protein [Oscillospiraceae bacterium]